MPVETVNKFQYKALQLSKSLTMRHSSSEQAFQNANKIVDFQTKSQTTWGAHPWYLTHGFIF